MTKYVRRMWAAERISVVVLLDGLHVEKTCTFSGNESEAFRVAAGGWTGDII